MVVPHVSFLYKSQHCVPHLPHTHPSPASLFPRPAVFTIMISCDSLFKIVGLLSPPFVLIVSARAFRVRWRGSRKYKSVGKSVDRPYPIRHNSSFSVCISAAVVANAYCIFPSFPSYKSETCVKAIKYSQWKRPAQLSFLHPFRSKRKISMAYMRRYSKSWLRYSVHEGPVHMLLYHTACSAYIWRFHQGALPFNTIWRSFGALMFLWGPKGQWGKLRGPLLLALEQNKYTRRTAEWTMNLPLCKFFLADCGIYEYHQNRFSDAHPHRAIYRRLYVPYSKKAKGDQLFTGYV